MTVVALNVSVCVASKCDADEWAVLVVAAVTLVASMGFAVEGWVRRRH